MPTEAEKAAAVAAAAAKEVQKAALTISNKIAGMSDVTKAFYLALGEDAQLAFLEKSAEDMTKEAEAAKAATDKAAVEAEAAKTGRSTRELELEKSNADLRQDVEALKAKQADSEIEKRADSDFKGYPGGSKVVVPLLKAYATLPEEARVASEAVLKAQCAAALAAATTFGGRSEEQVSKAAGAMARITEAAKAYVTEHKVTYEVALEKVSELREFADDVEAIGS